MFTFYPCRIKNNPSIYMSLKFAKRSNFSYFTSPKYEKTFKRSTLSQI